MKIALGADHAGFGYKDRIAGLLRSQGHETLDFGTHDATPVDYPDYGFAVGEAVASGRCERGVDRRQQSPGNSLRRSLRAIFVRIVAPS